MKRLKKIWLLLCICAAAVAGMKFLALSPAADHNDPNAVNSIFSDIDVSAADLYDLFGFPSDDVSGGAIKAFIGGRDDAFFIWPNPGSGGRSSRKT